MPPPEDRKARTIHLDLSDTADEAVGMSLGRYKLLEKVGEGGCGVVYVAEQTEPVRRRVAVKVIKLGMDTKAVVARFEAERQALAMMDHPNIAKVLDAGSTETGRPYFVMELVRGIRITEYCDQNKLGTVERLELFIKVCQAIQHAHQKGIIHRDIKPSNILVTLHDGTPVPKVIDFGIAKATEGRLTEATVYTQLNQFIGTPAYMSPEQAEMSGLDIDTRSDIYSLGVLLYELLTGSTPFNPRELMEQGIDAMRKTIREEEPARPSTRFATLQGDELTTTAKRRATEAAKLAHQLKGDLDWIVMKCLEKDRTRRYEAAAGLVADLRRHLSNEPVLARPPSAVYRLQKTFRRHKVICVAGAAVFVALAAGIGVSVDQAIRARRAESAKQRLFESEKAARLAADKAQGSAASEAQNARRNLYAANINLANQAWEESNLGKVRRLLASAAPQAGQEDLRGWEWRYLWGQARGNDLGEIARFAGGVFHLAAGPGDRMAAVGLTGLGAEERGTLLFDFGAGRLTNRRIVGEGPLGVAVFSPTTHWLASAGKDTNGFQVRVTDTEQNEIRRLPSSDAAKAMAFSRNGKWLAVYQSDGKVQIWRTDNWTPTTLKHGSGNPGVHFGKIALLGDGDRIAVGWSSGKVSVHNCADGALLIEFAAHRNGITALAVSPDGKTIGTGSGYSDSHINLWNAEDGKAAGELTGHRSWICDLAFSPDGSLLASAGADQTIRLWDAKTQVLAGILRGHEDEVYCLAFSSDGKRLWSGAKDGSVRFWQTPPVERWPSLRVLPDRVGYPGVAPDSRRLATLAADYVVWDMRTGEKIETLTALRGYRAGFDFSVDGKQLLTGGRNGKVRIWDFGRKSLSEFDAGGEEDIVSVMRLGETGYMVTVHGINEERRRGARSVKVWDFEKRKLFREETLSGSDTTIAAVSPQGHTATGHRDGNVSLWGAERITFPAHRRSVVGAAFTPDGKILATAGEEGTAKLWDVETRRELATLKGHLQSLHSLSISPDGRRLATGGGGAESVKLWDTQTHQELITLAGEGEMLENLTFSPDGNLIVGLNSDGHIHIWRAPSWDEINQAEAQAKERAPR